MKAVIACALLAALGSSLPLLAADTEALPPQEARETQAALRAERTALEKELAARPADPELRRDRLRLAYVESVSEKSQGTVAEQAWQWLDSALRSEEPPPADAEKRRAWLRAYAGALEVVKAKHAFWPPRKLEHLKAGLPALDSAVAAYPKDAEIRYVRLTANFYLPFFLGRKDTARVDLRALETRLAPERQNFRPLWFASMARFVLENGRFADGGRDALLAAWREAAAAVAEEEEKDKVEARRETAERMSRNP